MTPKQMIYNVLKDYGCSNTFQIKGMVFRAYGEHISEASISGQLRSLVAKGIAAKSPNGAGKMVYWITDYGKNLKEI